MLFLRIQKPVFVFQSANGKEFYIDPKTNSLSNRETAFANYEGLKSTANSKFYVEGLRENTNQQTYKVKTNTYESGEAAYLFNRLSMETKEFKNTNVFKFTRAENGNKKTVSKEKLDENLLAGLFSLWFKNLSKISFFRKFKDFEEEENELEIDINSGNMSDNKDKKRKKKWFVFA